LRGADKLQIPRFARNDNLDFMTTTDVLVIGGGPAGLAAAIAARQRGLGVTVVDSSVPPIDKPCGEGLMPDGLAALADLGISIPAEESHPFRGIRFVSSESAVDASFPSGHGVGIRRTALHGLMVERAIEAGVTLRWGTTVTALDHEGARLGDELVRVPWIIGADGLHSRVRAWAGLGGGACRRRRFAFRRHYRVAPWSDCMEIHWGPRSQLYITPIGREEICLVAISRDPKLRIDEALADFPAVTARLEQVEPASMERGALSLTCRVRRVCAGRVALIGDASGAVDAITGDGLCMAFRQAARLAECLAAGSLEHYQSAHRSLMRRPAFMGELMLTLERPAWLRRRVMRAFASRPEMFAKLLAAHVGELSLAGFAANGLALGWGMLAA